MFGTRPLLTLAFTLIGILVGTVGVYRLVSRAIEASAASRPHPKPASRADDGDRELSDPWADEEAKDEEQDDWDRDPWKEDDADGERPAKRDGIKRPDAHPPEAKPIATEGEQQ